MFPLNYKFLLLSYFDKIGGTGRADGVQHFLADRTNGRAYATVLRLSSVVVVCDVMYCG